MHSKKNIYIGDKTGSTLSAARSGKVHVGEWSKFCAPPGRMSRKIRVSVKNVMAMYMNILRTAAPCRISRGVLCTAVFQTGN